jgi:inositol 1,4,5-triphosphate receptor type 1
LFNVSFFILINFISLNIIFGIIIDTFGELRDNQYIRNYDSFNNCFVCGLTRADFGKAGIKFEDHKEFDHDPWNYIYYILYMCDKGEDELSGLEYYIWTNYMNACTDFIPVGRTLYLSAKGDDH